MKFSDLHLCVSPRDMEKTKRIMAKSSELSYSQIGVPLSPNMKQNIIDQLRRISEDFGLDFVTRLDLAPKGSGELLSALRRFRRMFEVVSVLCTSKPVARHAAKDRRVDLISFRATEPRRRFFDRAEAELASASSAALEIDMAQVLSLEGFGRATLISCLRREVSTAKSFGVPVVISSGASDALLLRKPKNYASLAFLFDMDLSLALEALSKNPASIVERNKKKCSPEYVAPGIRVVKEMKAIDQDC